MFNIFRKKLSKKEVMQRVERNIIGARKYISDLKEQSTKPKDTPVYPHRAPNIKYQQRGGGISFDSDVQYSDRDNSDKSFDNRSHLLSRALENINNPQQFASIMKSFDNSLEKTFVDRVIRHINKKKLRDSQVYKAVDMDRRLFSKIMSDRNYKPSKDTAVSLAIGLKLNFYEAKELLESAGYTFSHSNKRDIILEYFFREQELNFMVINEVLYNLGEKIIGR